MSSSLFKNVIYKMCLEIIYLIYMNKNDLALNSLKWLKPNLTVYKKMSSSLFKKDIDKMCLEIIYLICIYI